MTYKVPPPPKKSEETTEAWERWKQEVSKIQSPRVLYSAFNNPEVSISSSTTLFSVPVSLVLTKPYVLYLELSGTGSDSTRSLTIEFIGSGSTTNYVLTPPPVMGNQEWRATFSFYLVVLNGQVTINAEHSEQNWYNAGLTAITKSFYGRLTSTLTTSTLSVALNAPGSYSLRSAQSVMWPAK